MAKTKKERKHDTSFDETTENLPATPSESDESDIYLSSELSDESETEKVETPAIQISSSEEHDSPKPKRRNPPRKTTEYIIENIPFFQRARTSISNVAISTYQLFPSAISVGLATSVGAGLFVLGISSATLGLSTATVAISAAAATFVASEAARGLRSMVANYLLNHQKTQTEESKKEEPKGRGRKRKQKETPEEKADKDLLNSYLEAGKQADAWGPWLKHGVTHPKSWLPLVTKAGNVYQIGRATAAAERVGQKPEETNAKKACCKM